MSVAGVCPLTKLFPPKAVPVFEEMPEAGQIKP
jgi:hypothetical protein